MPPPGSPPDDLFTNAPAFATYAPQPRRALQLSPQQLQDHLSDVFATPIDLLAALPPWSSQGSILPETQARALHEFTAALHQKLVAAGKLSFKSCANSPQKPACLETAVRELARRLQRREPSAEAMERYLAVYTAWEDPAAPDEASRGLLSSLLLSPATLIQHDRYLPESAPSRRALMLWNVPSVELTADPIADPRFERHVSKLVQHWLGLETPDMLNRKREDGMVITLAQRQTMHADLVREVVGVLRRGGTFRDLFTFGKNKLGVLGHPYVLLNHAAQNHRSIVFRGLFVYRELLCQTVPFPSAEINMMIEELLQKTAGKAVTEVDHMRERLQRSECQACHRIFDPFGLRLNAFDMLGNVAPEGQTSAPRIDLPATLPGWLEETQSLRADGPDELRDRLSQHSIAKGCFARRWLDALTDADLSQVNRRAYESFLRRVISDEPLAQTLRAHVLGTGGAP